MDRFIGDLSSHTHQLKERSLPFGGVTLRYSPNHAHVDDDILPCDRYIRVHWRNFLKALRSFDDYCELRASDDNDGDELRMEETWWLMKIELRKDLRDLLEPVLATRRNLRSLILDRNEFGRDGVLFLCNIIETNSYLKEVSLFNNPVEDIGDLTRLCDAVSKHPSLEDLALGNIWLNDDEGKLSTILKASKNLKCLGLSGNGIGSRSAAAMFAKFLTANDNTTTMFLRDNDFSDESAYLFALALRNNKRLRLVDLRGNLFTQVGRVTILNSLFDPSSLTAVVESNHNCVVYIDESNFDELGAINRKGFLEENMHRKLFSALYATTQGGRVGRLLKDIPLGLMPDFLAYLQDFYLDDIPRGMRKHAMESLHQYALDDFDKAFSRQTTCTVMFETLRNWNLLLLYTNI
mmetsp:Transcript_5600/g.10225  ORF Transcript_5600/g.10225 Transcript_5600/m.10225 type:complete len:407 (-) Transcript_5600:164-1384(-)